MKRLSDGEREKRWRESVKECKRVKQRDRER